jgi:hypothetical protein
MRERTRWGRVGEVTRSRFLCCAVICAVSGAALAASISTSRDIKARPIHRVCLLPVDAEMTRLGMRDATPLAKEAAEWAQKIHGMLQHAVPGAGWQLSGDLTDDALASNDDLRQAVVRVKQKYDSVAVQLNKKPGEVGKGRYTLGDEVALLPCAADSDSLMIVHARGETKSNGRKAVSILAVGYLAALSNYSIRIAFVDAKSGEVTALTRIGATDSSTAGDPEGTISNILTEQFLRMQTAAPKH